MREINDNLLGLWDPVMCRLCLCPRSWVLDVSALGDAPKTASRLASNAAAGEVLVSEQAWTSTEMDMQFAEQLQLSVKGRQQPVKVHVLKVGNAESEGG
jgi:class 3 adenylate cyclase